jgi:hypothetical protein
MVTDRHKATKRPSKDLFSSETGKQRGKENATSDHETLEDEHSKPPTKEI